MMPGLSTAPDPVAVLIKGIVADPNATPASMVVVEHWFEELKQRVNGK
jgi:hypothetical protein